MKLKRNIYLTAATAMLLFSNTNIKAQNAEEKKGKASTVSLPSFGKGINFMAADSTFAIKINGRFQTLFIAENTLDNGTTDVSTKFFTRRARLKFQGFAFNPNITYKMELGLTNKDWGKAIPETNNAPSMILDAVLKWKMAKGLTVWIGQTKLPGNRERVISSQKLQFVDRSMANSKFTIDRDRGVQLHHTFKLGNVVFREIASVSTGEGRNVTVSNYGGYDYTGRIEVLPFGKFTKKGDYFGSDLAREQKAKLALGATYDFNDDTNRARGQKGDFLSGETDLTSIMLDLMFKYKGLSIISEYIEKTSPDPIVRDVTGANVGEFYVGSGINAQIGYLLKKNWEFAARYTHISPATAIGGDNIYQYTFGISKYVKGHNLKIQTDISLTDEQGAADNELMYRFQVEMAF